MFAIRQIIEDPQDVITFPTELRHRRTEVIFIALDEGLEQVAITSQPTDAINAFRGKGKGGAAERLLMDRRVDREREA
ncbi:MULTISPECIES: hypothetical protein [Methylomonas]|uniref:Uncharacterized protein n=1 Tax=Methylomonas koyamae TaxID=702114 RepID=A0A177NTQ0_9GAMM|nr:hypothetical protein [Methylomonas koyamae]OAI20643.1 hypothetical protein A1355_23845 [Methylomonas koyamae]